MAMFRLPTETGLSEPRTERLIMVFENAVLNFQPMVRRAEFHPSHITIANSIVDSRRIDLRGSISRLLTTLSLAHIQLA